ncbi:MAG: HK97 gp10 family phage protein, partial [bacterium]
ASTIRVGDIGDYAKRQFEQLLRAAVLETDSLAKNASPVDTGRFRASWEVGENSAPGGIKPEGSYPSTPPIDRLGYQQEKLGNVYSVHNNLSYAEFLANGSSPKAPAGWVQGIAKDVQGRVRIAAERIGRQS